METILEIKELENGSYEGYMIVTDEQTIELGISSGQNCCESYGYFATNDDLQEFVGAKLEAVLLVDTELKVNPVPKSPEIYDCGGVMFVNFETSKGTMQLAVYNAHNGYYGHSVYLKSNQLNHADGL